MAWTGFGGSWSGGVHSGGDDTGSIGGGGLSSSQIAARDRADAASAASMGMSLASYQASVSRAAGGSSTAGMSVAQRESLARSQTQTTTAADHVGSAAGQAALKDAAAKTLNSVGGVKISAANISNVTMNPDGTVSVTVSRPGQAAATFNGINVAGNLANNSAGGNTAANNMLAGLMNVLASLNPIGIANAATNTDMAKLQATRAYNHIAAELGTAQISVGDITAIESDGEGGYNIGGPKLAAASGVEGAVGLTGVAIHAEDLAAAGLGPAMNVSTNVANQAGSGGRSGAPKTTGSPALDSVLKGVAPTGYRIQNGQVVKVNPAHDVKEERETGGKNGHTFYVTRHIAETVTVDAELTRVYQMGQNARNQAAQQQQQQAAEQQRLQQQAQQKLQASQNALNTYRTQLNTWGRATTGNAPALPGNLTQADRAAANKALQQASTQHAQSISTAVLAAFKTSLIPYSQVTAAAPPAIPAGLTAADQALAQQAIATAGQQRQQAINQSAQSLASYKASLTAWSKGPTSAAEPQRPTNLVGGDAAAATQVQAQARTEVAGVRALADTLSQQRTDQENALRQTQADIMKAQAAGNQQLAQQLQQQQQEQQQLLSQTQQKLTQQITAQGNALQQQIATQGQNLQAQLNATNTQLSQTQTDLLKAQQAGDQALAQQLQQQQNLLEQTRQNLQTQITQQGQNLQSQIATQGSSLQQQIFDTTNALTQAQQAGNQSLVNQLTQQRADLTNALQQAIADQNTNLQNQASLLTAQLNNTNNTLQQAIRDGDTALANALNADMQQQTQALNNLQMQMQDQLNTTAAALSQAQISGDQTLANNLQQLSTDTQTSFNNLIQTQKQNMQTMADALQQQSITQTNALNQTADSLQKAMDAGDQALANTLKKTAEQQTQALEDTRQQMQHQVNQVNGVLMEQYNQSRTQSQTQARTQAEAQAQDQATATQLNQLNKTVQEATQKAADEAAAQQAAFDWGSWASDVLSKLNPIGTAAAAEVTPNITRDTPPAPTTKTPTATAPKAPVNSGVQRGDDTLSSMAEMVGWRFGPKVNGVQTFERWQDGKVVETTTQANAQKRSTGAGQAFSPFSEPTDQKADKGQSGTANAPDSTTPGTKPATPQQQTPTKQTPATPPTPTPVTPPKPTPITGPTPVVTAGRIGEAPTVQNPVGTPAGIPGQATPTTQPATTTPNINPTTGLPMNYNAGGNNGGAGQGTGQGGGKGAGTGQGTGTGTGAGSTGGAQGAGQGSTQGGGILDNIEFSEPEKYISTLAAGLKTGGVQGALLNVAEQAGEDVVKSLWDYMNHNDGNAPTSGSSGSGTSTNGGTNGQGGAGGGTGKPDSDDDHPGFFKTVTDVLGAAGTGATLGGIPGAILYGTYTLFKDLGMAPSLGSIVSGIFHGGSTDTGTPPPNGGNGTGGQGTGSKTSDGGKNGAGGGGGTSTGGAGKGQGNGQGGTGGGGKGGTGGNGLGGTGLPQNWPMTYWQGHDDHDRNRNNKTPNRNNLGNTLLDAAPPTSLLTSLAARRNRYTPFDLGYTSANESLLQRWSGAPGAVSGTSGRLLLTSGGNT